MPLKSLKTIERNQPEKRFHTPRGAKGSDGAPLSTFPFSLFYHSTLTQVPCLLTLASSPVTQSCLSLIRKAHPQESGFHFCKLYHENSPSSPQPSTPEVCGKAVPEVLSFILYYFGVRRDTGGIRKHDVKDTKVNKYINK